MLRLETSLLLLPLLPDEEKKFFGGRGRGVPFLPLLPV